IPQGNPLDPCLVRLRIAVMGSPYSWLAWSQGHYPESCRQCHPDTGLFRQPLRQRSAAELIPIFFTHYLAPTGALFGQYLNEYITDCPRYLDPSIRLLLQLRNWPDVHQPLQAASSGTDQTQS